jgi:hypothetical protein
MDIYLLYYTIYYSLVLENLSSIGALHAMANIDFIVMTINKFEKNSKKIEKINKKFLRQRMTTYFLNFCNLLVLSENELKNPLINLIHGSNVQTK